MACCQKNSEIEIPKPQILNEPLKVREKRLLGAGPSNPPDNVLRALSRPIMGHLHPETLQVFDKSQKSTD